MPLETELRYAALRSAPTKVLRHKIHSVSYMNSENAVINSPREMEIRRRQWSGALLLQELGGKQ